MDRNTESKYGLVDWIDTPRSNWDREFTHKTTFNAGKLVPFYLDMDIIPGTTIKNTTNLIVRMNTPLYPTMDNLYLDTYYFKLSKFWLWEHWRAMMGENDYGAWTQTIAYTEPKIETDNTTSVNDLSTYFGVRMGIAGLKYSKLAVNAYIMTWNEWFRDQNVMAPIQIDKTDSDLTADGTIQTGYGLLDVCRFHDYMSSALPQPQKGTAVSLPIGLSAPIKGSAPVVGTGKPMGITIDGSTTYLWANRNDSGGVVGNIGYGTYDANATLPGTTSSWNHPDNNAYAGLSTERTKSGIKVDFQGSLNTAYADLSTAVAATINAQRLAFATQRILERDAMGGTRYPEILANHYHSFASDESVNRPVYLGGKRIPINIETVLQNSSTDSTSPLGQTGAMSVTVDSNEDFTVSCTKDDIILGLLCVRADHTYQQQLPRQLTRTERLDRFWPEMAFVGNQPIYNYEIFVQGPSVVDSDGNIVDNQVFGYKEAWQEYMYKPNMISGELLSDYAQSLDAWHYGDDYSTLPVLSANWMKETPNFIDRTLAVQSSTHHQFTADILVQQNVTAPIPLHRTPGLIDHF